MRELAVQAQNGSNGTDRPRQPRHGIPAAVGGNHPHRRADQVQRHRDRRRQRRRAGVPGRRQQRRHADDHDRPGHDRRRRPDDARPTPRRPSPRSTPSSTSITTNRAHLRRRDQPLRHRDLEPAISGENQSAARGRIMDADFAAETAEPVAGADPAAGRQRDGGASQPAAADGADAAALNDGAHAPPLEAALSGRLFSLGDGIDAVGARLFDGPRPNRGSRMPHRPKHRR